MKATINLAAQELREVLSAVAEYNGYTVTDIVFRAGGHDVAIDEAVLQTDSIVLKVRTAPEDGLGLGRMSRMLGELRASYGDPGSGSGSGGNGSGGGGAKSGAVAESGEPVVAEEG